MLRYSVIFFVIAIIAAALGFGGIAGSAAGIAKILFIAFWCWPYCHCCSAAGSSTAPEKARHSISGRVFLCPNENPPIAGKSAVKFLNVFVC